MKNMIKNYREKAGLTQGDIAKAIGHQRMAGKKIEDKPIEMLRIGELFAIAHTLKCHPWELMGLPQNLGIENESIVRQELKILKDQLSHALDNIAAMTRRNPKSSSTHADG